ncbi:MAG: glycosyl hydrolase family 2 [Pedosphaera sp.]|nr:glycosyl hydrolase family 2 [Pedosphaera sp.]
MTHSFGDVVFTGIISMAAISIGQVVNQAANQIDPRSRHERRCLEHRSYRHCVGHRYLLWSALVLLFLIAPKWNTLNAAVVMPSNLPGEWSAIGRVKIQTAGNAAVISGGFVVENQSWNDAEITFRAKTPSLVDQVQIWGGFRYRDRDSRYVFALRGGNDNDLYLARYAPDGGAKFLGFAPLDFKPVPGTWYRFRVVALGNRFQIYLNDEKLPRINVVDNNASWTNGSVALGGGWLPAEFADLQVKPLTSEDKSAFIALGDKRWMTPKVDKEAERKTQRETYSPATFPALNSLRTELSLNGNWLFKPDYELAAGQTPIQLDYNDHNWHVMPVPSFWTPGLSWLHGETSFPELGGASMTKGVAESLYIQETKRCDSYTFDWLKTRAAWYRHYVELPEKLEGRRFELAFDAMAKVSEIWVNGIKVGTHTGMFGEVKCDVTKAVRPGRNVLVVHVISKPDSTGKTSNHVEGVAVTVEVTSAMLHSLPHGMFQDNVGGIWQPVKLTATAPVLVSDVFVEPGLHGADINLYILNSSQQAAQLEVNYTITSTQDGSLLYSNQEPHSFSAVAGDTGHLKLATPYLNPKLWSPQDPNLYDLEVRLKEQGRVVDNYKVRFGFRTFTVDGEKFLLNGKPFWLRGANPFPNTLRPNDAKLARRFTEIAREGNVHVTRSHIVPFTSTWLDAADQIGMAVSFEGTWPWLMLEGNPPGDDLIKVWRDEFLSLIHEHRNHPSIILWTVNNEMKFEQFNQTNAALLKQKWTILNETIKAMRQTDPTRPIVADSAYVRKEAQRGYQTLVKPEGLDDGDADDAHRYYGWYNESFFNLYDGAFNKQSTPGRPLISQEMSTGYPSNDDGHPVRFYLFKHHTPQALVGDDAYENADPAIFLNRQAFMTKGLAETLRRTSHEAAAGILYFSYFTWFQTPWSVDQIKPWPTYYALKAALQPVLVSAELYGRHFYAGSTIHRRVCIVNDAENFETISNSRLIWEFKSDSQVLAQGKIDVPPVKYYENRWLDVDFTTPTNLPTPRVDGQLVLRLEVDGKILSDNNYDITIASVDWAQGDRDRKSIVQLWNPGKQSSNDLFGMPVSVVDSISLANPTNVLIIGSLYGRTLTTTEMQQLHEFVSQGGRVLMLHPGTALTNLFPDQVSVFKAKEGEIVTMQVPESPVFSGIEPLDLAWFERGDRHLPLACTGVFQIRSDRRDTVALAWQCDIHGYLKIPAEIMQISGSPLLEIQSGRGRLLASELCFESAKDDPIARRLLMNAICHLNDN